LPSRGEKLLGRPGEFQNHACLDFGSAQIDALRQQAELEDAAEELRLAYVALTRAEHRCVIIWGKVNQCARSPLAWLLFAPRTADDGAADNPRAQLAARLDKLDEAVLRDEIAALAQEVNAGLADAMAVLPLPVDGAPVVAAPVAAQALMARTFLGTIPAPWRISSFSSLAARLGNEEMPDRDAVTVIDAVPPAPTLLAPHARRIQQIRGSLPPTPGGGIPLTSAWGGPAPTFTSIHAFPRGTRAGSCLHALLERVDFQSASAVGSIAAAVLDEFAYAAEWRPVLERLVADVVATPLNATGLCLAQVARGERLIELEFTFPLGSVAARAGYMKGFIDLVFRLNGRW
ncbi:MAG: hypothetical protein Q7J02_04320, partial [Rhodocyclaceae bacterium]|nr:hypothetical protein [Rhodocyclaceae bacterium]